jgi:hypothetical protein
VSAFLITLAAIIAVFLAVIVGAFLYAAVKGLTFREAWRIWWEAVDHEYREHPTWLTQWRRRRTK